MLLADCWFLSAQNRLVDRAKESTFKTWQLPGAYLLPTRKEQQEGRMRKSNRSIKN